MMRRIAARKQASSVALRFFCPNRIKELQAAEKIFLLSVVLKIVTGTPRVCQAGNESRCASRFHVPDFRRRGHLTGFVSRTGNERLVEQCHFFESRWLKYFGPPRQCIWFYWWGFHAAPLNPLQQNIHGCVKIVQLNSSPKLAGSQPQSVPLRPSPRAPLDDHCDAMSKQFLS